MKSNPNDRAADLVACRLFDAGCRYAFGMPGGEALTYTHQVMDHRAVFYAHHQSDLLLDRRRCRHHLEQGLGDCH